MRLALVFFAGLTHLAAALALSGYCLRARPAITVIPKGQPLYEVYHTDGYSGVLTGVWLNVSVVNNSYSTVIGHVAAVRNGNDLSQGWSFRLRPRSTELCRVHYTLPTSDEIGFPPPELTAEYMRVMGSAETRIRDLLWRCGARQVKTNGVKYKLVVGRLVNEP